VGPIQAITSRLGWGQFRLADPTDLNESLGNTDVTLKHPAKGAERNVTRE